MAWNDFFNWLSPIVASGALLLTWVTYSHNKRAELENHFYKLKHAAYSELLKELTELLDTLSGDVTEIESGIYSKVSPELLYAKSVAIDQRIYTFKNLVLMNALNCSEKVLDSCTRISDLIIGSDSDSKTTKGTEYLDQIYIEANQLLILFRNDLKLKELNEGLFKRIKR